MRPQIYNIYGAEGKNMTSVCLLKGQATVSSAQGTDS